MRTQSLSLVSLLACLLLTGTVVADDVIAVGTTAAQPGAVATLDITIENDVPIVAFSFGLIHDPAILQPITLQYAGPLAPDFIGIIASPDGLAMGVLIDYELEQAIPAGAPRLAAFALYDVDSTAQTGFGTVTPGTTGNPPIDVEFTSPTGQQITPQVESGGVALLGATPTGSPANRIRALFDTPTGGQFRAFTRTGALSETGDLPGIPTDFAVADNGATWALVASAQRVIIVGRTGTVITEIPTGPSPIAVAPLGGDGVFVSHDDGSLQLIYPDGTILYGGDGVGDSNEDGAVGGSLTIGDNSRLEHFANGPEGSLWGAGDERLFRLNGQGNAIVDVTLSPGSTIADIAAGEGGSVYLLLPDRIEKRVADGTLEHTLDLPPSTATTKLAVTLVESQDIYTERLAVLNPSGNQVFFYDWSENNDVVATSTLTHARGVSFISYDGIRQLWIAGQDPNTGEASLTSYNESGEMTTDLSFAGETTLLTADGGGIPAAILEQESDYDADGYSNQNELQVASNPFDAANDPTDAVPDYVPPLSTLTGEAVIVDDNHFVQLNWTWFDPTANFPDFYEITRISDGVPGDVVTVDGTEAGWLDTDVPPGTHVYEVIVVLDGGGSGCLQTTVVIGSGEVEQEVPIDVGADFTEIYDITLNSGALAGEPKYYVTDAANGQIYGLDENFGAIAVVPSPFEEGVPCTGIAYVPVGDAGNGSLVIGNGQSSGQMHLIEITLAGEFLRDLFLFVPNPVLPTSTKMLPGPLSGGTGGMDYDAETGNMYITGPDTCDIYGMAHSGSGEIDSDSSFVHPNPGAQQKGCTTKQCAQSNGLIGCTSTLYITSQTPDGTLEIIEVSIENGEATQIGEGISLAGIEDPGGLVFEGGSFIVTGNSDGSVYQIQSTSNFVRGDTNEDSVVDIGDAINTLNILFTNGTPPDCLARVDGNDDNVIDIADPIFLLNYLFDDGPEPPAPFRDSGPDPTPSAVTPCP
ncbi:MAG: hypothetical protein VX764_08715 [Planctomycetota bacterium]|nr:hypothetical protein [Planctomycetota bacterium]